MALATFLEARLNYVASCRLASRISMPRTHSNTFVDSRWAWRSTPYTEESCRETLNFLLTNCHTPLPPPLSLPPCVHGEEPTTPVYAVYTTTRLECTSTRRGATSYCAYRDAVSQVSCASGYMYSSATLLTAGACRIALALASHR